MGQRSNDVVDIGLVTIGEDLVEAHKRADPKRLAALGKYRELRALSRACRTKNRYRSLVSRLEQGMNLERAIPGSGDI